MKSNFFIFLIHIFLFILALNLDGVYYEHSTQVFFLVFTYLIAIYSVKSNNYILIVFLLMIGAFYLSSMIFLEKNDLKTDYMLKVMHLSDAQLYKMYLVLNTYFISLSFFSLTYIKKSVQLKKLSFNKVKYDYKLSDKVMKPFFYVLCFIVFSFYTKKVYAILNEGYLAYHLGIISVKKNMTIVVIELIFQFMLFFGVYKREKFYYLLFIIYYSFVLATGMRMPFIVNTILLLYLIYYDRIIKLKSKFNYIIIYLISIYILPPLFMVSNRYRFGALDDITFTKVLKESYEELFLILSITLDTLKGSVLVQNIDDFKISLFARSSSVIGSIYNKLLGQELTLTEKLNYKGFGAMITNHFSPKIFEEGITISSSFIAESYLYFGLFGAIISAFFHTYFSNYLKNLEINKNFISFLFFISFTPWFLNSSRNDFIGWFPFALSYFFVYKILYKLLIIKKLNNEVY